MFEVVILAFALSMDAFAVSLTVGANHTESAKAIAVKVAIYFGVFQGVMPLIGFWIGHNAFLWITVWENWIAFTILLLIGGKMIYETLTKSPDNDIQLMTHKMLFLLSIAVSIDALAAGFTLTILNVNPYFACIIIGLVTFLFSGIGVWFGARSGAWLQNKAALIGGLVLILIGFKVLLI